MIRRTLWWWMLHMDQQYSVTLGRPLGISGIGDCQPPEPLTTNPTILRLNEFVDHFTILARQILSSDGMMNVGRIDEYTDKLLGLWDTMPEALQFNETWLQQETLLPDWPLEVMSTSECAPSASVSMERERNRDMANIRSVLYAKVQSFLILLNRQRLERTQGAHSEPSPPGSMAPPPRPQPVMTSSMYGDQPLHPAPLRGRSLVVNSSIALVNAFMFFHYRRPQVLICWTMAQQCFNACMILILDAWETENENNLWLVNQAFAVFQQLDNNGVHKLAGLAVARISTGLAVLEQRRNERKQQAAASRGVSGYHPQLQIDTASMSDFQNDTVMGNTGMFLLEDTGLQSFDPMAFAPLGWNMAGSAHASSHSSHPTTPNIPSPMIPISQVTAAPFPVVTAPPYRSDGMMSAHLPSSYMHHQQQYYRPHLPTATSAPGGRSHQAAFTPINNNNNTNNNNMSLSASHQNQQQQQQSSSSTSSSTSTSLSHQRHQLSPIEQAVVVAQHQQLRAPRHHHNSTNNSTNNSNSNNSGSNHHYHSSTKQNSHHHISSPRIGKSGAGAGGGGGGGGSRGILRPERISSGSGAGAGRSLLVRRKGGG